MAKKSKKVISEDRNILKEAEAIINQDRPDKYGIVTESFDKIGTIVTNMLDDEDKQAMEDGEITGALILKVQIATKLVRNSYSPENVDHLRDMSGYAGLLDQYKRAKENEN